MTNYSKSDQGERKIRRVGMRKFRMYTEKDVSQEEVGHGLRRVDRIYVDQDLWHREVAKAKLKVYNDS